MSVDHCALCGDILLDPEDCVMTPDGWMHWECADELDDQAPHPAWWAKGSQPKDP